MVLTPTTAQGNRPIRFAAVLPLPLARAPSPEHVGVGVETTTRYLRDGPPHTQAAWEPPKAELQR